MNTKIIYKSFKIHNKKDEEKIHHTSLSIAIYTFRTLRVSCPL